MCTIDLGKMVLNPEEKSVPRIVKRMIAAVSIFFIPSILNILLEAAGQTKFTATTCWTNANTSTIATLKAIEEKEAEARRKAAEEAAAAAKKAAEEKKAFEEAQKKEEEKEPDEKEDEDDDKDDDKPESSVLLSENGTDGKVTVINGVFYKPSSGKSGAAGTKGSGPYGYNIYFYNRLKALVDAGKAAGHNIYMSTSQYGAWRPLENQEYFWHCYKRTEPAGTTCSSRNLAARPGTSNHGWGIASDLSYGSYAAKLWAHDNAKKFGLRFNLCNNVRTGDCKEDWHIEPMVLKSK